MEKRVNTSQAALDFNAASLVEQRPAVASGPRAPVLPREQRQIVEWLEEHARGNVMALPISELQRRMPASYPEFQMSYHQIQAAISDLVNLRYPIGSCPAGYFWIVSDADRKIAQRYLEGRIKKIGRRLRNLGMAVQIVLGQKTLELD